MTRRSAEKRFRDAAAILAVDPVPFLHSSGWSVVSQDLRSHLIPQVQAALRSFGIPSYSADEILSLIAVQLSGNLSAGKGVAHTADDAFAYGHEMILNWLKQDSGRKRYVVRTDETGKREWAHAFIDSIDTPRSMLAVRDDNRDPLELLIQQECEPVDLTVSAIAARTPPPARAVLPDVVSWLAASPNDKAGRHKADELKAAAEDFPMLTQTQLDAIAKITWGSRPDLRGTSLLLAFYRDRTFDPLTSTTHLRALRQYRRRMFA